MNEFKSLALLELRSLYGWNKFRHTKDKKEKRRYISLLAAWVIVVAMVLFYTGALSYGLILIGMSEIIPAYLAMIASLLIFAFGILKAGNIIFSKKGYDLLCSLPIQPKAIVMSRFLSMYVEDMMLTLLVVLPGIAVYGYGVRPEIGFYLIVLIGMWFIPIFPLVVSTAIGAVVTAISSRMKHKTLMQTILMLIFVLIILVGSFGIGQSAEDISPEMWMNLAGAVSEMIGKLYPPAIWFGKAAVHGEIFSFLLFAGSAVMTVSLMIFLISCNFHRITRRMFATSATHDYQMGVQKSNGMLTALYRREMKRYFASSIYVMNTIIGPIMGTIMSAAILVAGVDTIVVSIPLPIDIAGVIPFVFAGVFCMMTTSSVSISMEGKEFWIIKSLPVSTKMLFDSKIFLNLSLMFPFYLVSEVLLIVALRPAVLELLWLILIPMAIMIFSVVVGISVNIKLHSFDWEKEETVVKQSASSILGGMAGAFVAIVCCVLVLVIPKVWNDVMKAGLCILLSGVTALLYRANNRVELHQL